MRVVHSLPEARPDRDSVVTIGAFDGIHRGHQAVIDSVLRAARSQDRAAVVVTFFPHPAIVLGRSQPFYLTSPEEKVALLAELGLDCLVAMNFTVEMSRTSAADYVDMLVEQLRMREVHVGYDFAFGYQRQGTLAFLERAGAARGFVVRAIDAQRNDGEPISSSGIRRALRAGDVELAARWLGRPFRLSGRIAGADGAAAQLDIWQEHAVPADGWYACRAWLAGSPQQALADVGTEPSNGDRPRRTVAVRLVDADMGNEGAPLSLDFITRLEGARDADAAAQARRLLT